jgi:DNA-directed RNA polymerase specialized sigma24 family protein
VLYAPGEFEEKLSWVYGAALRAAAGEQSAQEATRAAFDGAPPGESREGLMERAVRFALARAPARSLAMVPPVEREAIGLAQILGMRVSEIAEVVGCEPAEVKRRIRRGMERLADPVMLAVAC